MASTPTFTIRIVSMDYYMASPIPEVDICYNSFQGQVVQEVPVIRIYGSTLGGQKTCLHVHQAFPYLYAPYDNDLPQNLEDGYSYVRCLAAAIEKAMKLNSSIGAKRQHVQSCSLVRAKKFYGYHLSEQLFIKIVLYYPEEVNRVAALLLGGGVLNHVFQPHESHIPYLLQFLIDNNLYGMGHIHLSKLKFRDPLLDGICKRSHLFRDVAFKLRVGRKDLDDLVALNYERAFDGPEVEPVTQSPSECPTSCGKGGISNAAVEVYKNTDDVVINHSELWVRSKVPREWLWSTITPDFAGGSPSQGKHPYKRQSTCELEGDATVQEILNQHQLMYIPLSQVGPEVKMVQSLIQIWEEEYSRTGLHLSVEKFNDQKPSSERVLKTLLHEQEYQSLLLNLVAVDEQKKGCLSSCAFMFSEKEIAAQSRKAIQASPSGLNSGERRFPCERLTDSSEQLVKCTQAANSRDFNPDLQVLPSFRLSDAADDRSMLIAGKQELNTADAFVDEEFVRSQMTKSTDLKDVDKEAIELLRWLASFQAASEDKEDEELVLSQLLRSDSVERVLERAHSNYEDASQKECEDILDSMEDVEVDKSNHLGYTSERSIPEYLDHASPEDVIPQLDGIWDDPVDNPRPSKSKDKKARKDLNPFAKDYDNNSRDVATSSSSADEPTRNRSLWGSLPLACSEKSRENLSITENMFVPVTNVREDQYSVNLGSVDQAKEPSLRDQMRKKRIRRPETLELEHLIPPRKMRKDNKKTQSMSDDLHISTSEKCNESRVSKDTASIQPFELRDCSQKFGKNLVDNKVSRYGSLPLVKQSTSDHAVEACEEFHSEYIRRNTSNEEIQTYLKSGTLGPNNDHETNERIALTKSVTHERSCRSIPHSKVLEEKPETGCEELQTCPDSTRNCGFQCNSNSDSWEQHIRSNTDEVRQLCGDDVFDDINIIEKSSHRGDSWGKIKKSVAECQASPKVENLESGKEVFLHGSGRKPQLSEKDDCPAVRVAASELQSLSQRNWLEDKLIPLVFHRQPPTKEQIKLGILSGSIASLESDGVYYGNVEDVPDAPVVIAGSPFEVKSREAKYLCPFFTGMEQEGSLTDRKCMNKDLQGLHHGFETVVGIQMHYQNDGSVLYLLTPVQPPPSSSAVRTWLSQVQVKCSSDEVEQQDMGIDSSSNYRADNKQPQTLDSAEATKKDMNGKQITGLSSCTDIFKVASPKYDETCVCITGSEISSQHREAYLQICQTANTDTSGCEYLNSSGQGCNMIHSSNHKQCADGLPGKCQPIGAHHILRDPHFKDGSIPVSSPSQNLLYGKLQKATTLEECPKFWRDISQISAPSPAGTKQTPISQTGFRDPASVGAGQQLTLMSIEIYAQSRGDLRPDPRYDAINIIVAVIQEDFNHAKEVFVLMWDEKANLYNRNIDGVLNCEVFVVNNEKTLFELFIQLVRLYDPDILMGWEIQGGSIGFLAERAAYVGVGLLKKISRTPFFETKLWAVHSEDVKRSESKESILEEIPPEALDLHDTIIEDEWGRTHGSGIHVGGRIVLNLWRIMRGEMNLGIYTLEAVSEAVLKRKVPSIPWSVLTRWFSSGPGRGRFRCIEYIIDRAQLNLAIMDQLDMINRTSELARIFGIDFFSVFSRGSQYRVESMMLRLAHTQNFLVVSPSKQQVASQPAMECIPLVMEPESRFYTDPVVVLDFQSLYPSMIIAYNLCFSTCMGKITRGKSKILGVTSYTPDIHLSEIAEHLFITPNGVMYVPPEVRQGVVPRLLEEILSTRIMVKNTMKKLLPTQKVLQRVLNARQLALKLIANVTYGYTAAGFSGRMPCAEIADSIVQCGRKTLENAINFVNSNSEWNARVVYGDTDSMFVLLKGRTREEAFRIGQDIASAITARNPNPVTLKMEKVYHPCVLLTKKRYVGYSYESSTQSKPTFDAKGIETVRRDSCPAVAKILERCLRILFESHDLSEVKSYIYRQWTKILRGRVSLQDFIFAKEVRLGTYSARASSLPPAAIVATKAMRIDPRAEPRYGERIRYVVVHGEPGARLVDMVVDPLELVDINTRHRLHDIYYITKQIIPALQRVFGLVGVDLKLWYSEMPRPVRPILAKRRPNISPSRSRHSTERCDAKKYKKGPPNRSTIDHYYLSQHCVVCGELIQGARFLCDRCSKNHCTAALTLTGRTSRLEKEIQHLDGICRHCGGGDLPCERGIKCISLDCPVFYERRKVQKELLVVSQVSTESGFYPPCVVELF